MDEAVLEALNISNREEQYDDSRQGKYMTFKIGQDVYGIELKYVNEILQMQPITPIPEVEHFIKGLINLRGKIIPVIDVADRFGKNQFEYNDRTCVMVIEVKNVEVGLIIEHVAEVVSIRKEDILPPPVIVKAANNNTMNTNIQTKFIQGIGKIDGEVKLLLDPVKLLSDDALEFVDKPENEEEE